jgi:hypothetical protein
VRQRRLAHHPRRRLLRGPGYFKRLGPGIVTGAADDDPQLPVRLVKREDTVDAEMTATCGPKPVQSWARCDARMRIRTERYGHRMSTGA